MAKVLVVDDDPTIRTVIVQALKGVGHQVFSASDGKEGLFHTFAIQPDLIIADLFMPEQEGLEMITKVRRQFPQTAILAISGASVASAMLMVALRLGATHVLQKPFDKKLLLAAVEISLAASPPDADPHCHKKGDVGPILPESH
jgi:DNA-binding response OmpR family regulator